MADPNQQLDWNLSDSVLLEAAKTTKSLVDQVNFNFFHSQDSQNKKQFDKMGVLRNHYMRLFLTIPVINRSPQVFIEELNWAFEPDDKKFGSNFYKWVGFNKNERNTLYRLRDRFKAVDMPPARIFDRFSTPSENLPVQITLLSFGYEIARNIILRKLEDDLNIKIMKAVHDMRLHNSVLMKNKAYDFDYVERIKTHQSHLDEFTKVVEDVILKFPHFKKNLSSFFRGPDLVTDAFGGLMGWSYKNIRLVINEHKSYLNAWLINYAGHGECSLERAQSTADGTLEQAVTRFNKNISRMDELMIVCAGRL